MHPASCLRTTASITLESLVGHVVLPFCELASQKGKQIWPAAFNPTTGAFAPLLRLAASIELQK
jgi:hypothetical protein